MKVLLLNQIPEVNNKYTFSLARSLQAQGIDIVVCGIATDNVTSYSDIPYCRLFEAYSSISNPIKKVLSYRRSLKKIISYCKENKVKIVHVQWYIFSPLDYWFHNKLRELGIKVVTTIHDLLPFNAKFYDFHFHKKIYQKSDMVVTQTTVNEEPLRSRFGVAANKIVYIPHGHYMDFVENATMEESRRFLGIPNDKKVILFFGQIKKVKGVDVLIKAMRLVADKYQDAYCIIAGKVWKDEFEIYQKLIDDLDLNNCVRTDIKYIPDEDIKYYFNAADIVALPYRQIYQSGVVLLACAYEKPIIATTEGEFLNVIKDKETGLLVASNDHIALAEAVIWYLKNPENADKYAKACKQDLSVRLSWDTIAEQIKKIYNSIL